MKLVGDTASGQPVFAMGPIKLTLPPGAQFFYPIGACSRCGEVVEFPEPVLTAADLELSGQPHLCQTCARTGIGAPGPVRPGDVGAHVSGVEPAASLPSSTSAPSGGSAPSVPPADPEAAAADAATIRAAAEADAATVRAAADAGAAADEFLRGTDDGLGHGNEA
ncbi:MAG: hypothetical protein M3011_11905 [Actinomycetota bacterium]|nr:hypothetical protein [Actinomycetota bacterium]